MKKGIAFRLRNEDYFSTPDGKNKKKMIAYDANQEQATFDTRKSYQRVSLGQTVIERSFIHQSSYDLTSEFYRRKSDGLTIIKEKTYFTTGEKNVDLQKVFNLKMPKGTDPKNVKIKLMDQKGGVDYIHGQKPVGQEKPFEISLENLSMVKMQTGNKENVHNMMSIGVKLQNKDWFYLHQNIPTFLKRDIK